jgi:hypothetical protein
MIAVSEIEDLPFLERVECGLLLGREPVASEFGVRD